MRGQPDSFLTLDLVVPSHTRYLSLIGNIAEEVAREVDDAQVDHETLAYHLNLAITEAVANAIQHGARGDAAETVRVCVSVDETGLRVQVHDHGQGFDLDACPTCDAPGFEEHGRGLFLICSVMDAVEYRRAESSNVLEMRKRLPHGVPLPA